MFLFLLIFLSGCGVKAQTWNDITKIVASERELVDNFGYSVSISGDYAIVGAFKEDDDEVEGDSLFNAGSAYIYYYDGTNWTLQQKIVASDRQRLDAFGWSVSISGNYAIVGAWSEDQNGEGEDSLYNSGSAYIFVRNGTIWTQQQKIVAPDRAVGDNFGGSVSIDGPSVIVGAYSEDQDAAYLNYMPNAGSAYIYVRDGTTWNFNQKIVASDRAAMDNFGWSVSISDKYAIVGANMEDEDSNGSNTISNAGSAYIFVCNESTWTQQEKIVASEREVDDNFGYSVSISGDYAIVGAYQEDDDEVGGDSLYNAGSALILFAMLQIGMNNKRSLHQIARLRMNLVFLFAYRVTMPLLEPIMKTKMQ